MSPRTVEEHLQRVLADLQPTAPRQVPVLDALGLVCAAEVSAGLDLPSFTNSAMDGYAVTLADLVQVPVELPVAEDIPAGDTRLLSLRPGVAHRIMTGAPVPQGAEAVVPVELTDGGTERVRIEQSVGAGNAIRHRGEDVHTGDRLISAGTRIHAHHLSALIAAGVEQIPVVPRPRVAVLTTGDELVPAGEPLSHGQIHDSNGPMLAALIAQADAVVHERVHVRDGDDLAAVVDRMLPHVDLVVTSGGVSAGAYEPVKDAYSGGPVEFVAVKMQPGKPQGFGLLGPRRVPLFALPGNPVSTLVSFQTFVEPALRVLAGRPRATPERTARVSAGWASPAGRRQLGRVRLESVDGELTIAATGAAGSHILGGLAAAQAIAVVPEEVTEVKAGDVLPVRLLPGEEWPDV